MTDGEKIVAVGAAVAVAGIATAVAVAQQKYLRMAVKMLKSQDDTIVMQAERIRMLVDDIPLMVFSPN